MRRTKLRQVKARDMALRVAQYSAMAGCYIPDSLVAMYSVLKPPFKSKHDRQLARSVCGAVLKLANVPLQYLLLTDMYVITAIVLARYKTACTRPPPQYTQLAPRAQAVR